MSHLLNKRCAAVYCRRSGSDGKLRMFEFPKETSDSQRQRYDIWAEVAGDPNLKIRRPRAYLCEKHFPRRQFTDRYKYKLVRRAIPSKAAWLTSSASADTSLCEAPLTVVCPNKEAPVEIKQEMSEDPLRIDPFLDEEIPVKIKQEPSEHVLRVELLQNEDISFHIDKEPGENTLRFRLLQNEDISFHIMEESSENVLRVELFENEDISAHIKEEPSEDQLRVELFENEDISVHIKEEPSEDYLS